MPADEALEALTIRPARLLGVDEFVGSIEEGKDADLVILTGEPLKLGTWVDTTIVDGQVVYRATRTTDASRNCSARRRTDRTMSFTRRFCPDLVINSDARRDAPS